MKKYLIVFLALAVSAMTATAQSVKIKDKSYGSIYRALQKAKEGDTIEISGIHTESITITKGVILRGNDPVKDIIQAEENPRMAQKRVVHIPGAGFSGKVNGAEAAVTLENLTIRHGVASKKSAGGGIFINKMAGTVTLNNLVIENNEATKVGGGIAVGGGNVDINNCLIRNNAVTHGVGHGGGLHAVPNNAIGTDITVNVRNSYIIYNACKKNGAGFFIDGNSKYGNNHYLTVNFDNVIVAKNSALGEGGGGFVKSSVHTGSGNSNVTANFKHLTMAHNNAQGGNRYGMFFYNNPEVNLYYCLVTQNGNRSKNDINFNRSNAKNIVKCVFGNTYGMKKNAENVVDTKTADFREVNIEEL